MTTISPPIPSSSSETTLTHVSIPRAIADAVRRHSSPPSHTFKDVVVYSGVIPAAELKAESLVPALIKELGPLSFEKRDGHTFGFDYVYLSFDQNTVTKFSLGFNSECIKMTGVTGVFSHLVECMDIFKSIQLRIERNAECTNDGIPSVSKEGIRYLAQLIPDRRIQLWKAITGIPSKLIVVAYAHQKSCPNDVAHDCGTRCLHIHTAYGYHWEATVGPSTEKDPKGTLSFKKSVHPDEAARKVLGCETAFFSPYAAPNTSSDDITEKVVDFLKDSRPRHGTEMLLWKTSTPQMCLDETLALSPVRLQMLLGSGVVNRHGNGFMYFDYTNNDVVTMTMSADVDGVTMSWDTVSYLYLRECVNIFSTAGALVRTDTPIEDLNTSYPISKESVKYLGRGELNGTKGEPTITVNQRSRLWEDVTGIRGQRLLSRNYIQETNTAHFTIMADPDSVSVYELDVTASSAGTSNMPGKVSLKKVTPVTPSSSSSSSSQSQDVSGLAVANLVTNIIDKLNGPMMKTSHTFSNVPVSVHCDVDPSDHRIGVVLKERLGDAIRQVERRQVFTYLKNESNAIVKWSLGVSGGNFIISGACYIYNHLKEVRAVLGVVYDFHKNRSADTTPIRELTVSSLKDTLSYLLRLNVGTFTQLWSLVSGDTSSDEKHLSAVHDHKTGQDVVFHIGDTLISMALRYTLGKVLSVMFPKTLPPSEPSQEWCSDLLTLVALSVKSDTVIIQEVKAMLVKRTIYLHNLSPFAERDHVTARERRIIIGLVNLLPSATADDIAVYLLKEMNTVDHV